MNPGDVRLIWFPFSRNEPQPYKKRPVLVLAAIGTAPDRAILVAMITSNERRFRSPGPGDMPIVAWQAAGLLKPSIVRTRRLWTAEERDFAGPRLGAVEDSVLTRAKEYARALLG